MKYKIKYKIPQKIILGGYSGALTLSTSQCPLVRTHSTLRYVEDEDEEEEEEEEEDSTLIFKVWLTNAANGPECR